MVVRSIDVKGLNGKVFGGAHAVIVADTVGICPPDANVVGTQQLLIMSADVGCFNGYKVRINEPFFIPLMHISKAVSYTHLLCEGWCAAELQ